VNDDMIEKAAEVIATAQNVPFVGPKQRRIAQSLADAGLLPTETEWGVRGTRMIDRRFGVIPMESEEAALLRIAAHVERGSDFVASSRNVTPWKDVS